MGREPRRVAVGRAHPEQADRVAADPQQDAPAHRAHVPGVAQAVQRWAQAHVPVAVSLPAADVRVVLAVEQATGAADSVVTVLQQAPQAAQRAVSARAVASALGWNAQRPR